jgi:hypothetical protein
LANAQRPTAGEVFIGYRYVYPDPVPRLLHALPLSACEIVKAHRRRRHFVADIGENVVRDRAELLALMPEANVQTAEFQLHLVLLTVALDKEINSPAW